MIFSAPEVHGTNEEILNFGVSGYGTDQEYLFYQLRGTNFVADEVVVALTPYNDIANNLASKQYSYLKPYFTLESGQLVLHNNHVRNSRFRKIKSGLSHHSRVWNLMSEFIRSASDSVEMLLKHNTAKARYARYRPKAVSDRDREGVESEFLCHLHSLCGAHQEARSVQSSIGSTDCGWPDAGGGELSRAVSGVLEGSCGRRPPV